MRTAFLFPGQGAYYPGALGSLRKSDPVVDRVVGAVDDVARARLGASLPQALWTNRPSTQQLLDEQPALLQLAIYAVSVASHALWTARGLQPQVHVGHSFGEIAALTCAGAYSVADGAQIVCDRVEALAAHAGLRSSMLAVAASAERVAAALAAFEAARLPGMARPAARLCIAVINHPSQTVVSGEAADVDLFAVHCAHHGLPTRALQSPYGFHHPSLARAAEQFAQRLAGRAAHPLRLPVYSPILGRYYRGGDDIGDCLAHHLTMPVDFAAAVRTLVAGQIDTFVECGALDALSKSVIRVAGPGRVRVFAPFIQPDAECQAVDRVIQHFQPQAMHNTSRTVTPELIAAFEDFWRARGPAVAAQIRQEFIGFLTAQAPSAQPAAAFVAAAMPVAMPMAAPVAVQPPAPTVASVPAGLPVLSRAELFAQLVAIYAQAMEYPAEVFTEEVELEAELGIDSVKQTEIIQRISAQYRLPPLPASFRAGDIRKMGQIVDFVHGQIHRPAPALA